MKKFLALACLMATAMYGAVIPIGTPGAILAVGPHTGATYTAATCVYPPTGAILSTYTVLPQSCSPAQTVTFSLLGAHRDVPGTWATWAAPPFTESATPNISFFDDVTSLTLTLSTGASVFGFEIEPDSFGTPPGYYFDVEFKDGLGGSLGTVTVPILGSSGARLFAGYTSDGTYSIKSAVITAPAGASGFAIAQIRSDVPEPATYAIVGAGLLALAGFARRRKV